MTSPARVRKLIREGDTEAAGAALRSYLSDDAAWTPQDLTLIQWYVRARNGGARFHQMPVVEQAGVPEAASEQVLASEQAVAEGIDVLGECPPAITALSDGRTISRPAVDLWTIPHATVFYVAGAFVVKDRTGTTISACSGLGSAALEDLYEVAGKHRPVLRIPGRALLLCDPSDGRNYSHWMLNHLTRLALYERAAVTPGLVLVKATDRPFITETLAHCDAAHTGAVALEDHPVVTVDELQVVSSVGPAYRHPAHRAAPWALDYLQDGFSPGAHRRDRSRIYVSRADAVGRRIVNEEQLMDALGRKGFERVSLTGLAVHAQAELFADAEIIVGPHGAGLANLAFARHGTRVLELFPQTHATPAFALVAESRGLGYAAMGCVPVVHQPGRPGQDDLLADVGAIQAWLGA